MSLRIPRLDEINEFDKNDTLEPMREKKIIKDAEYAKTKAKKTAQQKVENSLLSMPEMTDYTKITPHEYSTKPGALPKIGNALKRIDNAGTGIINGVGASVGLIEDTLRQRSNMSKQTSNALKNQYDMQNKAIGKLDYLSNYKYKNNKTALENDPEYQTALKTLNSTGRVIQAYRNKPTALDMNSNAVKEYERAQSFKQKATEGLSPTGQFLGNTAISIGQNIANMPLAAISPNAPLIAMGTQAMADKIYGVGTNGGSAGEALSRGLVSGAIEGATEKIPLDELLKTAKGIAEPTAKSIAKNIGKQALTEGAEEGTSYIANYGADKLFGDKNAKFDVGELGGSVLGGALSGGLMGGGAALVGGINNRFGKQQSQENIQTMGNEVKPENDIKPIDNILNKQKNSAESEINGLQDISKTAQNTPQILPKSKDFIAENTEKIDDIKDIPGGLPTNDNSYNKGTVGAAEFNKDSTFNKLEELGEKYGYIPEGAGPKVRVGNLPKSTDGKTRVSQFTRTMLESDATPESFVSELEKGVLENKFSFDVATDEKALKYADSVIEKGYERALDTWNTKMDSNERITKNDLTLAMQLYNQAANAGDTATALKLAGDMATIYNISGQNVQSANLMKKMTPAGNLYSLEKTVQKLNDSQPKGKENQKIEINPELAEKLLKSKDKTEMEDTVKAIQKNIAEQMDSSLMEAIREWRYFSMLANPTTHIKNVTGNVGTHILYRTKDTVGAVLEKTIDSIIKAKGGEGIERTKTVLSPKDKALVDFAKEDYKNNIKSTTQKTDKYTLKNEIEHEKNVFATNPIGKTLNKLTKGKSDKFANLLNNATNFNNKALEFEDDVFIKQGYVTALAKYMKANKHTPEYYKTAEGLQAFKRAQDYAVQQALEAAFHDDSKLATALNRLENQNTATKIAFGTLMPFKKTPINVAKRSIEYSPLGLAKGSADLVKNRHNTKSAEMSKAIDELAKGMTGTGLLALGMILASKGYINSGLSDDRKLNALERAQGKQYFGLNIGGHSITLEAFSPAIVPVLAGVGLYEAAEKKGKVSVGDMLDMIDAMNSPLVEMSFLSSINDILEDIRYADSTKDAVSTIPPSIAKNFVNSLMPTMLSKISNTIDDTKRSSSYIDKNNGYGNTGNKIINQIKYKNPLQHGKLPPSLDVWGREQKNGDLPKRIFDNFINPTNIKKINTTEADKEVERLYRCFGDSSIMPSMPNKYIEYTDKNGENKKRKDFTAEENTKFVKARNNTTFNDINDIVKTKEYKKLKDEEKNDVISALWDYNTDKAKEGIADDYIIKTKTKKIDNVIRETGMSKTEAIIYNTVLGDLDTTKEKNDYIMNSGLTVKGKSIISEQYVSERENPIDFTNNETYQLSQMSEAKQKHYPQAKKKGYTLSQYEKAYDIVSKQQTGYTKQAKIGDLQTKYNMSYKEATEFWDMIRKK